MRVYLDLCCLKRPFDRQGDERLRLESGAVLGLLGAEGRRVTLVRSAAHVLENSLNPLLWRRDAVRMWLEAGPIEQFAPDPIRSTTSRLREKGFAGFDALHLASAEAAGAAVFATCDDRLLRRARRHHRLVQVRVLDPVTLATEVL